MNLKLLLTLLLTIPFASQPARSEPFALPTHSGAMLLDLSGLHITQASAKPNANEIGIRAHDSAHTELLAFLFLTPTPNQNADSCRQADLAPLTGDKSRAAPTVQLDPDGIDTHEVATALVAFPTGAQHLYKYAGSGDQCVSIQIYADPHTQLSLSDARALLARQSYDPRYTPVPTDVYTYAGILYRTGQYKAAAPIYAQFLAAVPANKQTLTARRVATDNMGMSLGISGQVDAAREVFLRAIASDPKYPLYYYNLACADAEQGDAPAARTHLEQAFDRKANLLPGESMPDPSKDDSLLKLKSNQPFWTFVQTLR